jgi:hypothetical protein
LRDSQGDDGCGGGRFEACDAVADGGFGQNFGFAPASSFWLFALRDALS